MNKQTKKIEYGDFQTPPELAKAVCKLLAGRRLRPSSILEPTCGLGIFLAEAATVFSQARVAIGYDVNEQYVQSAKNRIAQRGLNCQVNTGDFFHIDWPKLLDSLPEPILVIGNPPWVTNSVLGGIGSENLPTKSNTQQWKGFDAMTGKSNFDISQWMLQRLVDRLSGRNATLAMLCKTSVARKVVQHAWKNDLQVQKSEIHRIDAAEHFNVSVDACLLLCVMRPGKRSQQCDTHEVLGGASQKTFGYHDGRLIADTGRYKAMRHLTGHSSYRWRSGVKHDCSRVMEIRQSPQGLVNGYGHHMDIEPDFVYPLAKSSDVAKGFNERPRRWMVVPQRHVGEDTSQIKHTAPKTWAYLVSHGAAMDKRCSSIYRKQPRFSVFGVGAYTFAPWKVAISGFYKSLSFAIFGPHQGKAIVFDDTVYAIGCESQAEATFILRLLQSEQAQTFYTSLIFWDSKRPITAEILSLLSLDKLATEHGLSEQFTKFRDANHFAVDET